MSVYSTPIKTCFDEGSSPSTNQSFYFTPRETSVYYTPQSKSRKRKYRFNGRVPKFNVYQELSRSEDDLKKDETSMISSPLSDRDSISWSYPKSYSVKDTLISFGKENVGVQFNSNSIEEKKPNSTPLKNISNSLSNEKSGTVFEARISSIGKQKFDLRITTEAEINSSKRERIRKNDTIFESSNGDVLHISNKKEHYKLKNENDVNDHKFGRESIDRVNLIVEKSKTMVDVPTQTEADFSLKVDYDEPAENMEAQKMNYIESLVADSQDIEKISLEHDNSQTSLIPQDKPIRNKLKIWPFVKVARLRISPVKRMFNKSSKYLLSVKRRMFKNIAMRPLKTLFVRKLEDKCLTTEEDVVPSSGNICTLCIENLSNKEKLMSETLSTLLVKLSSMENELKEIKGLMKNNAIGNSNVRCIQLPPPPPPPPPPNFLNSAQPAGTLKRKADLTTPENDHHAVKRPAIKNEKTQFSITVEDLKNVKLRKTPASILKRDSKDCNIVNGEEIFRSLKTKKVKKSNSGGKRRTPTLTELCSRENVTINRNSMVDSTSFTPRKESSIVIYEETPLSSKNTRNAHRLPKRKELQIESPVLKRINTGNNSSIFNDEEEGC